MEKIAAFLADKMLDEKMISQEDKDWFVYSLQVVIEKIIGYVSILLLAMMFNCFFQTVLFLLVFSGVRQYSGGFHLKHFWSCYLLSTVPYFIFLLLFQRYKGEFTSIAMLLVLLMVVGILCIGAVDNPAIHWNSREQYEKSTSTRIVAVIIYCSLVGLKIAGVEDSYLWFMGFGICLSFTGAFVQVIKNIKGY